MLLEVFLTAGAAGAFGAAAAWLISRRRSRGPSRRNAAPSGGRGAPSAAPGQQGLDELFDALPAAVLIVAPAGRRLLAANTHAREWLGRRQQPIETLRLDDVVVPDEGATAEALYGRLLHPRSPSDRFVTFRHAEGHEQEAEEHQNGGLLHVTDPLGVSVLHSVEAMLADQRVDLRLSGRGSGLRRHSP